LSYVGVSLRIESGWNPSNHRRLSAYCRLCLNDNRGGPALQAQRGVGPFDRSWASHGVGQAEKHTW